MRTSIKIVLMCLVLIFLIHQANSSTSFWNDENHSALMARGILQYGKPVTEIGKSNGFYQLGFYYLTAASFKLFGINEFAGRLPSMIAGLLLIISAYAIVKRVFSQREALLAAFLVSFSQIQLAWATQLRPYIWLELFTLWAVYFGYRSLQNKKVVIERNFLTGVLFAVLAILFHGSGFLALALLGLIFLYKTHKTRQYFLLLGLLPVAIISYWVISHSGSGFLPLIFKFDFRVRHYAVFFIKNYLWLLAGAGVGSLFLWRKDTVKSMVLTLTPIIIFAIAIFKLNSQYVRYSLPAMPFLYILFAHGIISLYDTYAHKKHKRLKKIAVAFALFIVFLLPPILRGKIILIPQKYYSINADVRENPLVDYKYAFGRIEKMIAGKSDLILMDAWNDRIPWYLPHHKFIFLVRNGKGDIDPVYGEKLIGTIPQFEQEKSRYKRGVVIVENWESMTPPELQDHIRKTLKHEFDAGPIPGNEWDKWSISIYSWGLNDVKTLER